MKFYIADETIHFQFCGNDGPKKASVSIAGIRVNQFLEQTISAICAHAAGKTNYTKKTYVANFLRHFCKYLANKCEEMPITTSGWNKFLLEFMRFYMSPEVSKEAISTKLEGWQYRIAPMLDLLRREEIIPYEVVVPRVNIKTEQHRSNLKRTLRGLRLNSCSKFVPISKILVDTSFAKSDAEYIEHIAHQSRNKIDFLKKILLTHWDAFLSDHIKFKELANRISADELNAILESNGKIRVVAPAGYMHLCSPVNVNSLYWTFAIVRNLLLHGDDLACISLKRLRSLPYFRSNAFGTHDHKDFLKKVTSMPQSAFEQMSSSNLLYRFAGLLSSIDFAAICGLLIIEHPIFTPLSIANAKINSKGGKELIVYTDDRDKIIFSVDKPRAGSRKSAVLSDLAASIILKVIELTVPIRRILKERDDPNHEYLFLGVNVGGVLGRNTAKLTDSLTGDVALSLCRLYPELVDYGLAQGTLSFKAIRNTMGVLRWYETGSIREMSNALGNTENVALESYMPPDILNAWNTRIIRRHQNTLIILAAHKEKYLLDVTDFSNAKELEKFIRELLLENKSGGNLFSNEINLRLSKVCREPLSASGLLNIRLCADSLVYLYAFSDWATQNNFKSLNENSIGLVELSTFIKHTCESSVVSNEISNILDIHSLKKIHAQALIKYKSVHFNFINNPNGPNDET